MLKTLLIVSAVSVTAPVAMTITEEWKTTQTTVAAKQTYQHSRAFTEEIPKPKLENRARAYFGVGDWKCHCRLIDYNTKHSNGAYKQKLNASSMCEPTISIRNNCKCSCRA